MPLAIKTQAPQSSQNLTFTDQPELPPNASPIPVEELAPEGDQPVRGVDVSAVAFPSTDQARPTHFVCGRNSGLLSMYRISAPVPSSSSSPPAMQGFSLAQHARYPAGINDVAFSGDGLRIAVCLEEGSMRLVDARTLREVDSLQVRTDAAVTCAAFSPQSNMIVAGTYAGTLQAYDTRSPRPLVRTLSPAHGCPVSSVSFHPDGTAFLSTGLDGLARVWDSSGPCLATVIGSSDRGLGSGVFSPNGRFALLGAMDDGALGLWDLAHSGRLKRLRKYPRVNNQHWMRAVFTEEGTIIGGSEDGRLLAWDPSSTKVVAEMDCASKGVKIPLACATSRSFVALGGIGRADPLLVRLGPS